MKNCFEGYLTESCKDCIFWKDGSNMEEGLGCGTPGPIMNCPAFKEMYEKDTRNKSDEE